MDEQQQVSVKPMELNYENNHTYIRAYNALFYGTGKICHDEAFAIDRSDYKNGYGLYAFVLTTDLGDEQHSNLLLQGSVRLVLKFAHALATTVAVMYYVEFENVIETDRNRNVIFDYGP